MELVNLHKGSRSEDVYMGHLEHRDKLHRCQTSMKTTADEIHKTGVSRQFEIFSQITMSSDVCAPTGSYVYQLNNILLK